MMRRMSIKEEILLMSRTKNLAARIREIRNQLKDEYLQDHSKPWVIGYSAGKDSSLLLHLTVEMVLSISPDQRKRSVHVLSNDTLVESPIFQAWVDKSLSAIQAGMAALGLPISVIKTHPDEDNTFWVNLLGRGYPAPNRNFRWCTDRMKIRPTTKFIQDSVSEAGEVILLLGVRKAESAARSARINNYTDSGPNLRLNKHNDISGCLIFRPLIDLTDNDVWCLLLDSRPPWGGTYEELFSLYRNAKGGECPFVLGDDDTPSCGSNSARFGCWTCTVVEKDNSINGFIDTGFEYLTPLASFRERIKSLSNSPNHRSTIRRNGQPGLGPLTIDTRRMLVKELLAIQSQTGMPLISSQELRMIEDHWNKDESMSIIRELDRMFQTVEGEKREKTALL